MNLYRAGATRVAISGSGNSPNVLPAAAWANQQDAMTIGVAGFVGGRRATLAVSLGELIKCDGAAA